jgi:predicted nucleic acid-binding protein
VTVAWSALEVAIPADALVALDTSALLAYLVGTEAVSPVAAWLLDGRIGAGRNPAVVSAVTVAELLVRPFRSGSRAVATVEGFLQFFGDIRVVSMDYEVAREAARIRATCGLGMPDAIVVASALAAGATVIVTNDGRWPRATERLAIPARVVELGRFLEAGTV